jgi:hypothetical protein
MIDTPGTGRARHPSENGKHPDDNLEACGWISAALGKCYGIDARHRHVFPAGGNATRRQPGHCVAVHLFDPARPGADQFCAPPGDAIARFSVGGWEDKEGCLAVLDAKMRKLIPTSVTNRTI